MRYLMYQPAMPDTASHASTRRQARTDGGGGEKESSVPELCSLESVCGQACVYRHIARCVFTTIFINHCKAFLLILSLIVVTFPHYCVALSKKQKNNKCSRGHDVHVRRYFVVG